MVVILWGVLLFAAAAVAPFLLAAIAILEVVMGLTRVFVLVLRARSLLARFSSA